MPERLLESQSTLQALGLTSLEAKIYLALALYGETHARSLSERLSVNRVDVYRSLRHLSRLGIVEVSLGPPLQYSAISPDEATKILIKEKEAKLRETEAKAQRIVRQIKDAKNRFRDTEEYLPKGFKFKLIFGRKINPTHANMVQKAKKEVITIWSAANLQRNMDSWIFAYKKAKASNVGIRILADITSENLKQATRYARLAEVRHLPNPPLRYTVIDKSESLLSVVTPTTAISERVSLWTDNAILAQDYFEDFEEKWRFGKTLAQRARSLGQKL